MKENNITSLSKSASLNELSDFWDNHDLSEFNEFTEDIDFEVNIDDESHYFLLYKNLSDRVISLSKQFNQPANVLLNKWVEEKVDALSV